MKKRIMALLLLSVILVSLLTACNKPGQDNETADVTYESYKDIPGVTDELIQEIESLKASRTSFSYAINPSTEAFLTKNSEKIKGFTAYYCNWLSSLFGIEFTPKLEDWDNLISGLDSEKIDFTGELTATAERREKYHMTGAIAERSIKYFYLKERPVAFDHMAETTLTFGFLDGATSFDYVSNVTAEDFHAVYVNDTNEAAKLLHSGEIDAFFEDGTAEAAFDQYGDISASEYFPLIYTPVSMSTHNDSLAPFIKVIDLYLEQNALYELTELYNQGEKEYMQQKFSLSLTAEEQAYIDAHSKDNPVKIGAEFDNYPVSFYNDNDNQWQGIALDVLNEISKISGLAFKVENRAGTTFPELLTELEDGEISMITELLKDRDRGNSFLWPEQPYCEDFYALLSTADSPSIKPNQILHSRIAVQHETSSEAVFDEWFPEHSQKFVYETMDECFSALDKGEVDYVMGSRNSVLSMTNYNEEPGFKTNILFDKTYSSSFGLAKDEEILASIISKAQELVDVNTISNDWVHKVFDYRAKFAKNQIPYLIALTGLLLLVLALMSMLMRRNKHAEKRLAYLVEVRTKELEYQTYNAQKASMAKSDFLSRMSHEIRTPLNAIIGMAQVQRQLPDLSEKARKSNEEILVASKHLLGLLNDILDMSKIESGKFKLENKPFALKKAMEEVVNMISVKSEEKSIRFTATTDTLPDVNVLGDKMRLKQVLINLLANAIKFSPENGQVTFTVTAERETNSLLFLHFSVTDTGPGISEEMRERLFKPFEQANQISSETTGSGLGLAISQNLVHNMGGQIKVDSVTNKGSTFYFTLSLKRTTDTPDEAGEAKVPNLQGKTVLVAEDILVNRVVLEELLKKTGIAVEVAVDGAKALERFETSKPGYYDIIFMDIQMPNMNGYEATEAIRALDREDAKTIPIVAMTAFAYAEDIVKAKESGMTDHMAKPLEVNILWEILNNYIS